MLRIEVEPSGSLLVTQSEFFVYRLTSWEALFSHPMMCLWVQRPFLIQVVA